MGLDMYLTAERYLWTYSKDGEDTLKGVAIANLFPELAFLDSKKDQRVKTVTAEIGYWRKANAIHAWFVTNVQDGKDDCERYFVPPEKLAELLEVINTILDAEDRKSKAIELLETRNGFFFGSTEYDEWYFKDLERTKTLFEGILGNAELLENWDIYYQSSW